MAFSKKNLVIFCPIIKNNLIDNINPFCNKKKF
jgi:hypothetical protein